MGHKATTTITQRQINNLEKLPFEINGYWIGEYNMQLVTFESSIQIKYSKRVSVCAHGCLFVCLYVCMFFCLFVCLFVCVFVCLFVYSRVLSRDGGGGSIRDEGSRIKKNMYLIGSKSAPIPPTRANVTKKEDKLSLLARFGGAIM